MLKVTIGSQREGWFALLDQQELPASLPLIFGVPAGTRFGVLVPDQIKYSLVVAEPWTDSHPVQSSNPDEQVYLVTGREGQFVTRGIRVNGTWLTFLSMQEMRGFFFGISLAGSCYQEKKPC